MYCPDCGRDAREDEKTCPACGYPISSLRTRLRLEHEASIGWAQKIVGIPEFVKIDVAGEKVVSFATDSEKQEERDDAERHKNCARCGAPVEIEAICPNCGDRLPSIIGDDPFTLLTFLGVFRLVFSPSHFGSNLTFPRKGGYIQPILWPGVLAAIFIFSYPFARIDEWAGRSGRFMPDLPVFVGLALIYMPIIPIVVYLSAGFSHIVAIMLGGFAQFVRNVRLTGAILFWMLLGGSFLHILQYSAFFINPFKYRLMEMIIGGDGVENFTKMLDISDSIEWQLPILALVLIPGWIYGWAYGGLYRLSWWKAAIHAIIVYFLILAWVWISLVMVLPMKLGGLL